MICAPGAKPRTCEKLVCVKPATNPNVGSFSTPIAVVGRASRTSCCELVELVGAGVGIVPPPGEIPLPPPPQAVARAASVTTRSAAEVRNCIGRPRERGGTPQASQRVVKSY